MSLEQDILTQTEIDSINEIVNFITNQDYLPTEEAIRNYILDYFTDNSVTILKSRGTPLYILLSCIAKLGQINAGLIKESVSKMLYTQANGDDLSLCAANYGYTRIEAKATSMVLVLTSDKKITISANTKFTDGNKTDWVTQKDVELLENVPTRVNVLCSQNGAINYISPISSKNPIAGLQKVEVDTTSIVVGREQESDTELKDTIAKGIAIQGGDDACSRALLQLRMVNSAFVKTNAHSEPIEFLGAMIDSRQRYVAVRVSNPQVSLEEADLIAQTIGKNTIYNANYQKPKDNLVKFYFGITEENLTKPLEEGGAGLDGVNEASNCVLVRNTLAYGNFVDIYFYIAQPTSIDVLLDIRYFGSYTNNEKENMTGQIKQLTAQAVSEIAQVGSSLLTSQISYRLKAKTDLNDKLEIRSILLKLHNSGTITQALDAKAFEYFSVYDIPSKPYAGVIITES